MSKGGGGGLGKEDTKQDHPLTAVVLCDSYGYDKLFEPVCKAAGGSDDDEDGQTNDSPWCLVPMCNAPLLSWTLESLAQGGVEQAILFSSDAADTVRDYLQSTPYTKPHSTMSVTVRSTNAATPGDVMREVDALGILAPTDFLVVQAGFVGSVDFKKETETFQARRTKDPNFVLSALVTSTTRSSEKYAVHVIDEDEKLYHYEESRLFPRLKRATLPLEALPERDVQFRADLYNVGAVICSIEVPALFTENFDYQVFFPDFTNGILTSDLLGKTICIQQLRQYAGNVTTPKSFAAITRALIERRCWPIAPDENLPCGQEPYEERRGGTFYGTNLDLARNCTLEQSLVGHSSNVGPSVRVKRSILGESVQIGSSSQLTRCYVADGVRIGRDCIVEDSILAKGAQVGDGSSIKRCVVGPNIVLGKRARLSRKRVRAEPTGESAAGDQSLGDDSKAFLMPDLESAEADHEADSDEEDVDVRNNQIGALGSKLSELRLSSSESSLSSLSRASSTTSLSTLASVRSTGDPPAIAGLSALTSEDGPSSGQPGSGTSTTDFKSECIQSLERSFEEGHTVENATIEIKTLRMASNVALSTVRSVVISFILSRCDDAKAVGPIMDRWGGLVVSLMGEEGAMIDTLVSAQAYVANERNADVRFFLMTLKALYESDVVSDDAVFEWYKSPVARSTAGENGKKLWMGSRPFVEALVDDDDVEEEDESDDE